MEVNWKKVSNELPSHSRAVAIFPHHNGNEFACWNEYHKCWDTPDGDDYMCDKDSVFCWVEIPDVPQALKEEWANGKSK